MPNLVKNLDISIDAKFLHIICIHIRYIILYFAIHVNYTRVQSLREGRDFFYPKNRV